MRISDWSSDVCSSDLLDGLQAKRQNAHAPCFDFESHALVFLGVLPFVPNSTPLHQHTHALLVQAGPALGIAMPPLDRSPATTPVLKGAHLLWQGIEKIKVKTRPPHRFFGAVGKHTNHKGDTQ